MCLNWYYSGLATYVAIEIKVQNQQRADKKHSWARTKFLEQEKYFQIKKKVLGHRN